MTKVGSKVKYIGPDLVAYKYGKYYLVTSYDEEMDMYGVMSELDESYMLGKEVIEEIKNLPHMIQIDNN